MNLVIVESPTKAKTISQILPKGYIVTSSFGHVRDLPKSVLGIDVENNFEPKYVIPSKAKVTVAKLKKLADKADKIILATDEDREGEAIAWHLIQALKLKAESERIVFHEITKRAILQALEQPRPLDQKLVDAQQARRVLDRLVGYELSPFLWKKVAKGLSAGRVQSVAVRLIVERERVIQAFQPQEYWRLLADLQTAKGEALTAQLQAIKGELLDKLAIKNQNEANKIVSDLQNAKFIVTDLQSQEQISKAPTPFKTSTLQQAANSRLGYSAKQTMMLAQRLYESGYITYMRTDSLNLSAEFLQNAHDYLQTALGNKYCLAKPNVFKTKAKAAQEAHEAIRPTEAGFEPEQLRNKLDNRAYKLYKLIWRRSLASQMPAAIYDKTAVKIKAADYEFMAQGSQVRFDGYLKIYSDQLKENLLPELKIKDELALQQLRPEQKFTQGPSRYSDATLVKELEKNDIGRPSTYAPTIATIEARNYVERDETKKFKPTEIAFIVIDLLTEHFPKIVDIKFTAKLENQLDKIADGQVDWQPVIAEFYGPFHQNLENKYNEVDKKDIMPEEKSDQICDKCNSPMIIKTGRYGKFLACSAFPECKNIKSMPGADKDKNDQPDSEQIKALQAKYQNEICDLCGQPLAVKVGRFGPFLACTAYPKCKGLKNIQENGNGKIGVKCPNCQSGEIVQKRSRRGLFYACNQYPKCKNAYWGKPTGVKCPDCGSLLLENKDGVKCSNKECDYQK